MSNLPAKIDILISQAVQESGELYRRMLAAAIIGATDEEAEHEFRDLVLQSIVMAQLFGASSAWSKLLGQVHLPDGMFDSEEDLEGAGKFAKRPDLIRMPLDQAAEALRNTIPGIVAKTMAMIRRSAGLASFLLERERVTLIEILAPRVARQLAQAQVSLLDFVEQAESAFRGTAFADLTRSRLENVFRTNLATATNEAHWNEMHSPEVASQILLFRYDAVDDQRVRPHHDAFDGFVAPSDWPSWRMIWPPNGYQCRCSPPIPLPLPAAREIGMIGKNGEPVPSRYKKTWRRAISAGLLDASGNLSYPRKVALRGRDGRRVRDSFPGEGFA